MQPRVHHFSTPAGIPLIKPEKLSRQTEPPLTTIDTARLSLSKSYHAALGCVFCSCCGHVGNALALSKLCGTQSGMSTAFAAPSSHAQHHDADLPFTPPRHAAAGCSK